MSSTSRRCRLSTVNCKRSPFGKYKNTGFISFVRYVPISKRRWISSQSVNQSCVVFSNHNHLMTPMHVHQLMVHWIQFSLWIHWVGTKRQVRNPILNESGNYTFRCRIYMRKYLEALRMLNVWVNLSLEWIIINGWFHPTMGYGSYWLHLSPTTDKTQHQHA